MLQKHLCKCIVFLLDIEDGEANTCLCKAGRAVLSFRVTYFRLTFTKLIIGYVSVVGQGLRIDTVPVLTDWVQRHIFT